MYEETGQYPSVPALALVGATGRTGRYVIEGALERGYRVRALARDPSKLEKSESLAVVKGSVADLSAVRELISGVDIVISCLGTSKKPNYIVESGLRVILEAIRSEQPKPRLVFMSSIGLGDSRRQCQRSLWSLLTIYVAFPLIGKELFADMERAENLILAAKDVRSVIVRCAILNDKRERGYRALTAQDRVGKAFLSRRDVAAFMLDAVTDSLHDGKVVSLFSA